MKDPTNLRGLVCTNFRVEQGSTRSDGGGDHDRHDKGDSRNSRQPPSPCRAGTRRVRCIGRSWTWRLDGRNQTADKEDTERKRKDEVAKASSNVSLQE